MPDRVPSDPAQKKTLDGRTTTNIIDQSEL